MAGRWSVASAAAVLAVALAACSDPAETDGSSPPDAEPTASPTPSPTSLPAGDLPEAMSLDDVDGRTVAARPFADFAVASGDGVWVSGVGPGAVRYDARGRITARSRVPGDVVQALAATDSAVVVPSLNPSLAMWLDATTGALAARVRLPASPVVESAVGIDGDRAYLLVEPSDPRIVAVGAGGDVEDIPAPEGATAVRFGYGALWVPTSNHTVERLDLATQEWTSITVGPSPRFLDVGFGAVWVMNQGDGSVTRIDARSSDAEQIAVTGTPIGGGDLTVGGGAVWLRTDSSVARIDPTTREITHLVELPRGSGSAAATDRMLLITNHDHDAVHLVPLPLPG